MVDILFPRLSEKEPDADGVVASWLVADGDLVADGQLVAEVMVDKVASDVTAPAGGRIHLLVPEEEAVSQGEPIARIE